MIEYFVKTLIGSLDIPALLEAPQVKEAIVMLKNCRDDFAAIKANQIALDNTIAGLAAKVEELAIAIEDMQNGGRHERPKIPDCRDSLTVAGIFAGNEAGSESGAGTD